MPIGTKIYKADQTLFMEGEESRSLFIIRKGAVSIRKKHQSHSTEISKVLANEVIGELSFFDRQPRSATAVAIMEVEAIEISFESMENIYNNIPDYMKTIVAAMADRLRKANVLIAMLQKNTDNN